MVLFPYPRDCLSCSPPQHSSSHCRDCLTYHTSALINTPIAASRSYPRSTLPPSVPVPFPSSRGYLHSITQIWGGIFSYTARAKYSRRQGERRKGKKGEEGEKTETQVNNSLRFQGNSAETRPAYYVEAHTGRPSISTWLHGKIIDWNLNTLLGYDNSPSSPPKKVEI